MRQHNIVCKISLQKRKNNFLKANSKSVSVNLKIYGKLPNKSVGCIVGALAENQIVKHGTKSISKTFKSFYSTLAVNLLEKLPKAPNQYAIKLIYDYYKKLPLSENFKLNSFEICQGHKSNTRLQEFEILVHVFPCT